MTDKILLSIKNLTIKIGAQIILSNISLDIKKNQVLGLVGESGSGKSFTALSILDLINIKNLNFDGEIIFNGIKLNNLSFREFQKIRGKEISIIFQEPMSSLNPSMKCGDQISEIILNHEKINKKNAKKKSLELIQKVQLKHSELIYEKYPHQLSGGQQQRIMIAIAIACKPKLLIADEPTTSLDSIVKNDIISLIKSLQHEYKMSVLFISHDLKLVAKFVDSLIILKNGLIIEKGVSSKVFKYPKSKYTQHLINSSPPTSNRPNRLITSKTKKNKLITKEERTLIHLKIYNKTPILKVNKLNVSYGYNKIIKDISFDLYRGETLGIVGESGSGKSTIAKSILGIVKTENGEVYFKDENIKNISNSVFRKKVQLIFQDPYSSLNPEVSVGRSIIEPMIAHKIFSSKKEMKIRVLELLNQVGLLDSDYNKFPNQFSGGQRQRIVIARALALNPEIIICDESVSALDVSVQAQILNLLSDLKERYLFTFIFISHDMSVIKYFTDRLIVLKKGEIVEFNETDLLFEKPKKPYTKALLKASDF
ncbi:ABC transporter ATP-binding protein [Flavobacteriaceae bacterium]|nr:ABC transporter ATP-binding protein [Flavobacteriaceae bacterium]MDA9330183.1 ABC transporter ATP-binding protein [bacterium]MDB4093011.1 ABC transporter ATP-binding protein [Flavobacteriaceae bacterium]MDC1279468.1 ABC transporter ATP-binding protein [Flavobacteriaceae bacterium]MDC1336751.1 ABC transporter ATP-binding protein [Flavobacteriaceae bacterium]